MRKGCNKNSGCSPIIYEKYYPLIIPNKKPKVKLLDIAKYGVVVNKKLNICVMKLDDVSRNFVGLILMTSI